MPPIITNSQHNPIRKQTFPVPEQLSFGYSLTIGYVMLPTIIPSIIYIIIINAIIINLNQF